MQQLSSRNPVVRASIAGLYRSACPDSLDRWTTLLWESCGVDPSRRQPFHDRIAKDYDVVLTDEPNAAARLLFAVQAFFAGVVQTVLKNELDGFELDNPFFGWAQPKIPEGEWDLNDGLDRFGDAYQRLYPAAIRKALGEFYTPDWLAEYLFRKLDPPQTGDGRILDPTCGSGIFLLTAIKIFSETGLDTESILQTIQGFDLNPLAVFMTRANIALALKVKDEKRIPVFLRDTILDEPAADDRQAFFVIGNPPWLNWDRLPVDYREKTKPLWERYGLFSLSGSEARHGGAKKELAQLMIYRVAEQYLKTQARLAMILPFSIFQTGRAGEGFRRFRLPDGEPLGILAVDDFSGLPKNPFGNIGTAPATILLEKGEKTAYPVSVVRWKTRPSMETAANRSSEIFRAEPIDPSRSGSPWMIGSSGKSSPISNAGKSDYRAYLGANSGGANGVFWLEILGPSRESERLIRVRNVPQCGKRLFSRVEAEIEKELVFPLLQWGDIERFQMKTPNRFILLPQDLERRRGIAEDVMRQRFPRTFDYLKCFEAGLSDRAAFRKYQNKSPFYSMYNVGHQTVAPIKVVWRRMDKIMRAAVVETLEHPLLGRKPIVPQETCVLIPCRSKAEAEYLIEILNGSEVDRRIRSFSAVGSKGFGSPGILDHLGIRLFDPR